MLKNISINNENCMLDGLKLSDITLNDIKLEPLTDLKFKIAVPENCKHPGGVNIFGKGFGNYNQDIDVSVYL